MEIRKLEGCNIKKYINDYWEDNSFFMPYEERIKLKKYLESNDCRFDYTTEKQVECSFSDSRPDVTRFVTYISITNVSFKKMKHSIALGYNVCQCDPITLAHYINEYSSIVSVDSIDELKEQLQKQSPLRVYILLNIYNEEVVSLLNEYDSTLNLKYDKRMEESVKYLKYTNYSYIPLDDSDFWIEKILSKSKELSNVSNKINNANYKALFKNREDELSFMLNGSCKDIEGKVIDSNFALITSYSADYDLLNEYLCYIEAHCIKTKDLNTAKKLAVICNCEYDKIGDFYHVYTGTSNYDKIIKQFYNFSCDKNIVELLSYLGHINKQYVNKPINEVCYDIDIKGWYNMF